MEGIVIGRKKEKKVLTKIYNSPKSEFVAVYGRRRVGKTFLIREFYNEKIVFQAAGLSDGGTKEQLYSSTAQNEVVLEDLLQLNGNLAPVTL